jgi:4-amino-4-deoxy-L-arabinose transferase-like glycosyltransferase
MPAVRPLLTTPLASQHSFLLGLLFAVGVLAALRLVMAFAWPVPLSVDEAQYLVWSREFQWGYYSKPPVIAWMLGVGNAVCPQSLVGIEGCTRWLQPLAMAGAGLGVALCAHALFGRLRITAWSLALFCTMPVVGFYAQVASTDAWLLCLWSMGLYAFIRANERPAVQIRGVPAPVEGRVLEWWILVGVCTGLGLLTKYSMGAFVISAFVFLLSERQLMRPGPWIAAGVAFIVYAPNLAWNAHWGFPTFGHHADILVHDAPTGQGIEGLLSFFGAQWLLFGPVLFGMLWFGTARKLIRDAAGVRPPFSNDVSRGIRMALCFAWPILLIALVQSGLSRSHANWAAPAAIGISIAAAAWWMAESAGRGARLSRGTQTALWGSLLGQGLVAALLLVLPWIVQASGWTGDRARDPFVRLAGFSETAEALRPLAQAQAQTGTPLRILARDRDLLAGLAAYLPEARVYYWDREPQDPLKPLKAENHWALQKPLSKQAVQPDEAWLLIQRVRICQGQPRPEQTLLDDVALQFDRQRPLSSTHAEAARTLNEVRLKGLSSVGVSATWVSRPMSQ